MESADVGGVSLPPKKKDKNNPEQIISKKKADLKMELEKWKKEKEIKKKEAALKKKKPFVVGIPHYTQQFVPHPSNRIPSTSGRVKKILPTAETKPKSDRIVQAFDPQNAVSHQRALLNLVNIQKLLPFKKADMKSYKNNVEKPSKEQGNKKIKNEPPKNLEPRDRLPDEVHSNKKITKEELLHVYPCKTGSVEHFRRSMSLSPGCVRHPRAAMWVTPSMKCSPSVNFVFGKNLVTSTPVPSTMNAKNVVDKENKRLQWAIESLSSFLNRSSSENNSAKKVPQKPRLKEPIHDGYENTNSKEMFPEDTQGVCIIIE